MDKKNAVIMDKKNFVTIEELGRDLSAIPGMVEAIEVERANLLAAQFIERTRKSARLSQGKLAQRIGVTQPRVSQMEKGEGTYGVSVTLLARVARACGGSLRLIFEVPDSQGLRKYK
jgi:DNA-binding XRE family transcriptional regulator